MNQGWNMLAPCLKHLHETATIIILYNFLFDEVRTNEINSAQIKGNDGCYVILLWNWNITEAFVTINLEINVVLTWQEW